MSRVEISSEGAFSEFNDNNEMIFDTSSLDGAAYDFICVCSTYRKWRSFYDFWR
jgi:hypothetical protein